MKSPQPKMSRAIYLFGWISLLNDVSADMISPFLPIYLASLGIGPFGMGIMEGLANFFSYLFMLLSGWYADRRSSSKFLTHFGYALSAVSKIVMAISWAPLVVVSRITDRIGKGIRTAPRDQLMTEMTPEKEWGRAFGIQRAMDHTGSSLASPLAFLLLLWTGKDWGVFILIAAMPALASVLFILPQIHLIQHQPRVREKRPLSWKALDPTLKRYTAIIFLSALGAPSELFIFLRLGDFGMGVFDLPWARLLMTGMALIAAYYGGRLGDVWSRRRTIAVGWSLFVLVYFGFAFNTSMIGGWILLALFGLQNGLVESSERVYAAHIAKPEQRSTVLGWFYFANGMGIMVASILFGFLWTHFSSQLAFICAALTSCVSIGLLATLPSDRHLPNP